jgi:hypothetical protein
VGKKEGVVVLLILLYIVHNNKNLHERWSTTPSPSPRERQDPIIATALLAE